MTGAAQMGLFEVVGEGALYLTANHRLAAHLRTLYGKQEQQAGRTVWRTPDVLPLSVWVEREWRRAWPKQVLLSGAQALAVWEQIVAEDAQSASLMNPHQVAERAWSAWGLVRGWRLDPDNWEGGSAECAGFSRWAKRYRKLCTQRKWADRYDATDWVIKAIKTGDFAPPSELIHAGFDDLSEQEKELFAALEAAGIRVSEWPRIVHEKAVVQRLAADDVKAEATLAARWVRARLTDNHQADIGIVVPDLGSARFHLIRALRDQLAPAAVADWDAQPPVNFSLGRPLSDLPVIAHALLVLGVGEAAVDMARLGRIVRSPFLAGAEDEYSERAQAMEHMVNGGFVRLSLADLNTRLGDTGFPVDELQKRVADWVRIVGRQRKPLPAGAWAAAFDGLLWQLGWPGEGANDERSRQGIRHWKKLLSEFATLDAVGTPLSRAEAARLLARMAAEAVFQPSGQSQVKVLGTLEAAGLSFDHLWVMGLSDNAWPQATGPNPFVPYAVQREKKLPHGTPEGELAFARGITERLLAAAPEVVVSHPKQVEGREVRASPLIADVKTVEAADLMLAEDVRFVTAICQAGGTEPVIDRPAPAVPGGVTSHGGASLFADQAACPFKGFATHRLAARAPEEPWLGFDNRERGTLPHQVLELVWNELGDQATLVACSPKQLAELVKKSVEQVLENKDDARKGRSGPFVENERERLTRLTLDWLDVDRARPVPFTVVATERSETPFIGGVTVRLKVDRIDRLEGGGELLIDYKTGRASKSGWNGERPEAPQLPLYAVTREDDIAGLAFGKLKREEGKPLKYDGVSRIPGALAEKSKGEEAEAWQERLDGWKTAITNLAMEFAAGRADVAPENPEACRYCNLKILCRVAENDGYALDE